VKRRKNIGVVEEPRYPICDQNIFSSRLVAACSNPSDSAHMAAANSKNMRKTTPLAFFLFNNPRINAKARNPERVRSINIKLNSMSMIFRNLKK
jgi:hypothetical protein